LAARAYPSLAAIGKIHSRLLIDLAKGVLWLDDLKSGHSNISVSEEDVHGYLLSFLIEAGKQGPSPLQLLRAVSTDVAWLAAFEADRRRETTTFG